MNGGETIGVREDDKEEKDKLREMFGPYECKVGGGASLFDDWKDWAPDFLDQCSIPVRKIKKNQ